MNVEFHPGKGKDRYYLIDGEKEVNGLPIVSVTTILKEIGDKFGQAAWWGMTVGANGVLDLLERQLLVEEDPIPLLTKHKLTVNHVRDSAADRGTDVHADGEDWARTGKLPDPKKSGWVEALHNFITTEKVVPLDSEVLVGSRKHAYAGTFDLLARFPKLKAFGVVDYKSKTKPPKGKAKAYEQHHLQTRGYEDARVEMGHTPSDFQCVVNLYPDGTYAIVQSHATSEQWQACLAAYRALTELKAAIKAAA